MSPTQSNVELACIEVGGGSLQTVLFDDSGGFELLEGAHQPPGARLALAVPGLIGDGVVVEASNLGWRDTDPVAALGLAGPAALLLNDAEAAALGEVALRDAAPARLVYLSVGTGVGGAVVEDGVAVRANLFGHNVPGHGNAFGTLECRCGRKGCLETVAAGWALPDPLGAAQLSHLASCIAKAIDRLPLARTGLAVLAGGIPKRYPALIDLVSSHLRRPVQPGRAPDNAKSAAAWGLRFALDRRSISVSTKDRT